MALVRVVKRLIRSKLRIQRALAYLDFSERFMILGFEHSTTELTLHADRLTDISKVKYDTAMASTSAPF